MAELTRRQQQGVQSREEILDAAARLMARHGYAGTSMSRLVKESGLPASSIYWHFGSKDGVLAAVMDRGAQRFFAGRRPLDDAVEGPEQLRQMLAEAADALHEHPEFLKLFFMLVLQRPEDDQAAAALVVRVREEAVARVHAAIRSAFAEHGTRRATRIADELTDFALAFVDGTFIGRTYDDALDARALVDQMHRAMLALADDVVENRPRVRPARRARPTA
jgi:AcrR family transcriptional regulator